MARLAIDSHNRKTEEIYRVEHEFSEATSYLKSTLDQVLTNESRVVRAEVELELRNTRYVELVALREAEKRKMAEL